MAPQDFDQTLRNLDRIATPVRRRPDRETWRFEAAGHAYYLHFYPPAGRTLSRGPATKEFAALKTLQTLKIPAVRAVALLSGLRFGDRTGDGVVTAAVEPAVRLDAVAPRDHATARDRLIEWLAALSKAGLGHADLRPDSFLYTADRVVLADAVGLTRAGLTREQLMQFAHAAGDLAPRGDRVRVWRELMPGEDTPPPDRYTFRRFQRDLADQPLRRVVVAGWTGQYLAAARPIEWSIASKLFVTDADWQREWPRLLALMSADGLDVLKRDRSGDVLGTQATLAGVPVDVIVKRPRPRFLERNFLEVRPSRAKRAWTRTRWLVARRLPVEQPLAVFERRVFGYAVESIAVFERVPGITLEHTDLGALSPPDRENLFRRCGRMLRRIGETGLAHTDAKSSNWIVFDSATAGPTPVLIDAYGIRGLNLWLHLFGLHRLLRAMRNHPQYTPADSLQICQGFAPRATPQTAGDADAH